LAKERLLRGRWKPDKNGEKPLYIYREKTTRLINQLEFMAEHKLNLDGLLFILGLIDRYKKGTIVHPRQPPHDLVRVEKAITKCLNKRNFKYINLKEFRALRNK
jgi:hypothetical protein